jgi:hypothetical protein
MSALAIAQLVGMLMGLAIQAPSTVNAVHNLINEIQSVIHGDTTGTLNEESKALLLAQIQTARDILPKPA